eukprot:1714183-Ditylum_brightwellii.AAC.1
MTLGSRCSDHYVLLTSFNAWVGTLVHCLKVRQGGSHLALVPSAPGRHAYIRAAGPPPPGASLRGCAPPGLPNENRMAELAA